MPTVPKYISQIQPGGGGGVPQLPSTMPGGQVIQEVGREIGQLGQVLAARAEQWKEEKDQLTVEQYLSEISDLERKKRISYSELEGKAAEGITAESDKFYADTEMLYKGKLENDNQRLIFMRRFTGRRDAGIDYAARHEAAQRQAWKGEVRQAAVMRAMSDAEAFPERLPAILNDLEGSMSALYKGHNKAVYWEPARAQVIMSAVQSLTAQNRFGEARAVVDKNREYLSGADEVRAQETIKGLSEREAVDSVVNLAYTAGIDVARKEAAKLKGANRYTAESRIDTFEAKFKSDQERAKREAADAEKRGVADALINGDWEKAQGLLFDSKDMDGGELLVLNNYMNSLKSGQIKAMDEAAWKTAQIAIYSGDIKDVADLARYGVPPDKWQESLKLITDLTEGLGGLPGAPNQIKKAEGYFDDQVKLLADKNLAAQKEDFMQSLIWIANTEKLDVHHPAIMEWARTLTKELKDKVVLEKRQGMFSRNLTASTLFEALTYKRPWLDGADFDLTEYRPERYKGGYPPMGLSGGSPGIKPWMDEINTSSSKWGIDPAIVASVIMVESGGNPKAVGPPIPRLGGQTAKGLGQFIPGTARAYGLAGKEHDGPANIEATAHYLSDLMKKHNGNINAALNEYSGGGGQRYMNAFNQYYGQMNKAQPAGPKPGAATVPVVQVAGLEPLFATYGQSEVLNAAMVLKTHGKQVSPETVEMYLKRAKEAEGR